MDLVIKKYLFDNQESIDSIEKYPEEKRDFSIYEPNKMLRRAIEREFEIIGKITPAFAIECFIKWKNKQTRRNSGRL